MMSHATTDISSFNLVLQLIFRNFTSFLTSMYCHELVNYIKSGCVPYNLPLVILKRLIVYLSVLLSN